MRALLAVAVLLSLAACTPAVRAGSTADTLDVACSRAGVEVSHEAVAAGPAGVRLRVSTKAPAETYLNLAWPGGGMGDPVPEDPVTWTVPVPPGELTVHCSDASTESARSTVIVVDPEKVWRSTTLADLGCPPGAVPSWVVGPGIGDSPRAAVEDLITLLAAETGTDLSVHEAGAPAPVGYVGAVETWIIAEDGDPHLTALVSGDGSSWTAQPDQLCG